MITFNSLGDKHPDVANTLELIDKIKSLIRDDSDADDSDIEASDGSDAYDSDDL